jgi:hypothetical protein
VGSRTPWKETIVDTKELLANLQRLGVVLTARQGRLRVDSPRGAITQALRAELAQNKAELLAFLERRPPVAGPPPWHGQKVAVQDLPAFRARWGLRVVGGDPDLDGEPWTPKVYLVEF